MLFRSDSQSNQCQQRKLHHGTHRAVRRLSPLSLFLFLTRYRYRITAILISRFLIDLQEANIGAAQQQSLASVGSLNFNRVIGSLASSLPAPGGTAGVPDIVIEDCEVHVGDVEGGPDVAKTTCE